MRAALVAMAAGGLASIAHAQGIGQAFPVLDESLNATYQDGRSHLSIQQDVARRLMDPSYEMEWADPEDVGPISACFAEGSNPTPEQMLEIRMLIEGFGSRYELGGSRWGGTAASVNLPANVSWSFVPDGISIPGRTVSDPAANSELFSRMDTLFGAANRATWITQFENCFSRWGELMGITYTRVQVGGNDWDDGAAWGSAGALNLRGDVRICMRTIDGGSNILAYNSFPGSGVGGDMVIDRAESWNATANTYRFLRNTVMHEHGHGLGLAHSCPGNSTKLMEPLLATGFDGPQQDDLRGAMEFYGDIYEPNNTSTQYTDLATLTNGVLTTIGNAPNPDAGAAVSNISTLNMLDGDSDYFRFTLDVPRLVNLSVRPIGSSYLSGPQNADGSCSAGVTENGLAAGNLVLTVLAANGTTVYYTQDTGAAGANETVTGVLVPQGNNFIRITESGTTTNTQMYKLDITPRTDNLAATASDGTFSDRVTVFWPIVPSATTYQLYRNTSNSIAGATLLFTSTNPTGVAFDDTTAVAGVQYYYYVRVEQFGNGSFRYMVTNGNGEPGHRLLVNQPPTANAGSDQTVTDADNSGSETVTLNGAGSTDTDGTIVSYLWLEGAAQLAPASASPTLNNNFSVGTHTITLTVTDDDGAQNSDTVVITVNPFVPTGCDTIDFNGDGLYPDTGDIDDFLSVFSGGPCSTGTCGDIDFNNDGLLPDTTDIDSLLSVFSGGPCI